MTNGNIGDFGARLKEAMSERGLTGRELAAKAGTTEATVSRYAGGERRRTALPYSPASPGP